MKRTLQVVIDAGDTTCDGCERQAPRQWWCDQFNAGLATRGDTFVRLPECLAAEARGALPVELVKPRKCPECEGKGRKRGPNRDRECYRCAGTGRVSP